MQVVVVGAGAIGLLYGGWLQSVGAEVAFVARGSRLEALREGGLSVAGRLSLRLDEVCAVPEDEAPPADAVLLAVKLYDVVAAGALANRLVKPEGAVMAVQNGVGVYDALRTIITPQRLVVGPVYAVTRMTGPTSVSYGGPERVILGQPEHPVPAVVHDVVALWRSAGIDASVTDRVAEVLWTKFVGLATGAAVTCLSRLPAGIVYHDPALVAVVRAFIAEALAVGRAEGIVFPADIAETTMALAQSFPPDSVASMRHDLDAGRRLELDGFSGEIVRLAAKHGIAVPRHELAYAMLRPFRDGRPRPQNAGVDGFPMTSV